MQNSKGFSKYNKTYTIKHRYTTRETLDNFGGREYHGQSHMPKDKAGAGMTHRMKSWSVWKPKTQQNNRRHEWAAVRQEEISSCALLSLRARVSLPAAFHALPLFLPECPLLLSPATLSTRYRLLQSLFSLLRFRSCKLVLRRDLGHSW